MQVMRQKGAGPNGLLASQLLLMPPVWWNAFAKLWGVILATSQIPESWRYSRIALVAKHTGGFRPIGLTDVCWRCGARLIIRGIRSWATSWMTPGDCGGLPSRSTADAHRIVAAAIRSGSKAFIQEDLQKYYDTIHFPWLRLYWKDWECLCRWSLSSGASIRASFGSSPFEGSVHHSGSWPREDWYKAVRFLP